MARIFVVREDVRFPVEFPVSRTRVPSFSVPILSLLGTSEIPDKGGL